MAVAAVHVVLEVSDERDSKEEAAIKRRCAMAFRLEEKDSIHETIANYCFYFDGGEFDKWVDMFTDDGTFDAGRTCVQTGNDALRAFIKNIGLTNGLATMKDCG